MTTINPILNAYVDEIITEGELRRSLERIGFSSVVVDILVGKAEHKRKQVQSERAIQNDTPMLEVSPADGSHG